MGYLPIMKRTFIAIALALAVAAFPAPAIATATPSPSPAASPVPAIAKPGAGNVWINELLPNPAGTDSGNEWVELANRTDGPLDLSGLTLVRITGSTLLTVPSGTVLPGGGYAKFILAGSAINTGDTVVLKSGSTELDRITYDGNGTESWSWERLSAGEGAWTEMPTPGAANPVMGTVADPSAAPEPAGTAASATTVRSTASGIKRSSTSAKARARKLPASGPSAAAYLIPLALAAVYWYRQTI